ADNGSKDNCGISRLSLDRETFDCTDLGEQTLTLTATDAAGNISEASFTVTVLDTLAPVVLAGDITLYLDAAGNASLSPEDIDHGSSDNCGIVERNLRYTAFDCGNVGVQPVQYTLTDGSGNRSTVVIQVTVRDTTAPEVLTRNAVLELNSDGKAVLSAEDIDDGSTDNCTIADRSLSQTDFSCNDLGRRMVTLTVKDVNGNESTDRAVVEVKDPTGVCPCSYGLLAFDGITLKNNAVSAGGVGVINSGKKVKLRNTVINLEGTFVKAPQSRFDNQSEASTYIRGAAPTPGAFRNNSNKDKKKEKVGKGESLTLAAGRYGKIKAGKDATLNFSGGEVYIRSLKVKKNAHLAFTAPTTLLVRNGAKLGKNTALNTSGEQVSIYAGGGITVGNASEVRGVLHTQGRLKTRGGGEITSLEGLFIAAKIQGGKNTHWAGGGVLCSGNEEPEQMPAAKKERRGAESEEAQTMLSDSTGIRISVWPNPVVNEVLKISVESEAEGGELHLVDFTGNTIRKKTFTGHQVSHEINMRQALPGIYILRVSSAGKVRTLRVVKQ
ncbi:MAG: T9SS type A sorting domain-containing protein, partial [Leadbetterella sp.]|nr:T9SS type A sorting domain-containing protein [Leadbetterella sp.]